MNEHCVLLNEIILTDEEYKVDTATLARLTFIEEIKKVNKGKWYSYSFVPLSTNTPTTVIKLLATTRQEVSENKFLSTTEGIARALKQNLSIFAHVKNREEHWRMALAVNINCYFYMSEEWRERMLDTVLEEFPQLMPIIFSTLPEDKIIKCLEKDGSLLNDIALEKRTKAMFLAAWKQDIFTFAHY